ncbi:AAA domain-containing protein [Iodidimonas sp. SYSU 1G8]|uniref:AAA domain-containing protein n=1 Tax=Iodidimonas sp. SYSU 1G8 TaxID=3133967 RepID=UPI0031FE919F
MTESPRTFRQVTAAHGGVLPVQDLLHLFAPLMRAVVILHENGRVAALAPDDIVEQADGSLALAKPGGLEPRFNDEKLRDIQPHAESALKIVGEYRVTTGAGRGSMVEDLDAEISGDGAVTKPIYLRAYACWEQRIGHHDELTDVFCLGLLLASLACGLDFEDEDDVARFSANRGNLFALNRSLHPVVASLVVEMTMLNRHERASDLINLARRLEDYRDQPVGLDVDRVLSQATGARGRRGAVLEHLRDRLFDLSRRNRLIHFRPTQASVNLTVASVPIVLRLESVKAEELCTWESRFASDVLGGGHVSLGKWLRFEDQPYLPSAFDRILQEARRDRAEYGFSHLRLVVAFLRWHNLKEAPDERIVSPLLWLPVEVTKKKGVRDQYILRCAEPEAEFNPALRHHLRQLYDIDLPETINLTQVSLADIHAELSAQIQRSEPGVRLNLQTRPEIRLIHEKAVQRLRQFQRRRENRGRGEPVARPDFSYEQDDYRPLGQALFEKFVRPSPLPQRIAVGAALPPRAQRMAAQAGEAESKAYALAGGEGHRFSWEIDLTQVTLANFNYKKMSLVRDYTQLIDDPAPQPSFDRIFSIEPRALDRELPPTLPAAEQWSVVPSDATQDAAVALARTGRSFIIQGPPGTGKSQTITNLIADFAARGKRVLFVCEKRAALDVVFNRLRQAGLEGLACLIHDSQEDKKGFVLDLKDRYETWVKGDDQLDHHQAVRQRTLEALDRHLGRIEEVEQAMRHVPEAAGANLRTLIRRLLALPSPEDAGPAIRERLPSLGEWDRHGALIVRVYRSMTESFGLDSLAAHPVARVSAATVAGERCYAEVEHFVGEAERLLDLLDAWFEHEGVPMSPALGLDDALELTRGAREAATLNLAGNLALLEVSSSASAEMAARRSDILARETALAAAAEAARHWRDPLSVDDTRRALEQARDQEPSFFKFLSGSWRKLKRTVTQRYDFSAHAVAPSITDALARLADKQSADTELRQAGAALDQRFATPDAAALSALAQAWRERPHPVVGRLIAMAKASGDPSELITDTAKAAPTVEALHDLCLRHLDGAGHLSLEDLAELVRDLREGLADLPDLLPLLRAIDEAGPRLSFVLRSLALAPEAMEALIVDEAIAAILRAEPALHRFDTAELASSARRAARAKELLHDQNAAAIRALCQRQFLEHVKQSAMSVTQLDGAGRQFKKLYATGRRELEHEFGKTMRFRSIRDLASSETGAVVIDLKPIWLMSPLSVSDTLPLAPDLFDVVVFDEASQIPMEEAVPALCRAPQVIVVGDEMQLPPTSFFASARDEDEMQVTAEEEGEAVTIVLDAESLLNQAARNLPATLLAWHYRSRSEALISFSNAAFYDGRLVTVPDRNFGSSNADSRPIRSDDVEMAAGAASRVLDRAISFHTVADGVYDKRANPPEARTIAHMVRDLLARENDLSIGIVAFSEAQQSEIEAALESLGEHDSAFAARLEREYVREEDGQFNGLFVKNLENVQGDERDIILLSICYAPGADGRMPMNFGPINQRGGEKRLNVIFSRARRHMAVISTIRAEAITNTHNDGARALRTFLAFAEAQDRGDLTHGQAILATLNPDAERVFARGAPADALRAAIAEALRQRGHEVRADVGSATFRCDLAVVDPDGTSYRLAILLDNLTVGDTYERFVFQPTLLRRFGWRVIDIPSSSWLRDPEAVIDQIERALEQVEDTDDDPFDLSIPLPAMAPSAPSTKASATLPTETQDFTELRLQQGRSDKFWKVAVNGPEMTVMYGRTGTKGTTLVKVFDSAERAEREARKLMLEKTRKGYEQTG